MIKAEYVINHKVVTRKIYKASIDRNIMTTKTKPSFREERKITTMNLDDVGLSFNSQLVGPDNFVNLRKANYGEGFRMPTFGQLAHLVHASLENRKEYKSAQEVVDALRNYWLVGDTSILWTPEGMYAQDFPEIKGDRVSMNERTLKSKLGARQEGDVVYSDDGKVRFTPYGFKTGEQSASDLSRNAGIIAIFGIPEEAEAIARSSEHYKFNTNFWTPEEVDTPKIRVPDLGSGGFDGGLIVGIGGYWGVLGGGGRSFGVREGGEASRLILDGAGNC